MNGAFKLHRSHGETSRQAVVTTDGEASWHGSAGNERLSRVSRTEKKYKEQAEKQLAKGKVRSMALKRPMKKCMIAVARCSVKNVV